MNPLEFAWRMSDMLIWPLVVLLILVLYRSRILATLSTASRLRVKAGPIEVEWEPGAELATRNVAGALAESAVPPADDGPIPTNLVDLIPMATANPRRGIRAAFWQVRRALDHAYPQLAGVRSTDLRSALDELNRQGALDADTAAAVLQLRGLWEYSETEGATVDASRALEFLLLAEGAIHAILRGAPATATGGPLVRPAWRGIYNNDYPIELAIESWDGDAFAGVMEYPGSDTATRVSGRAERLAGGVKLAWRESDYVTRGRRSISFDGEYRATVLGSTMAGAWYSNERRLVGTFELVTPQPAG